MKTLSIIVPAYNEENTVYDLLEKVVKSKTSLKKEIIIVNDGSVDKTQDKINLFIKNHPNERIILLNKDNGGKGSAVRLGIINSKGEIIVIQDADLEYDPNEYQDLINPILDKKTKVVYGSRLLGKNSYSHISFYLGGILVTLVTNVLFLSRLTDEPTCYKVFESKLIKSINIKSDGFEWEPEVTAKILKSGEKIKEIPISYYPRRKDSGKKINWKDGLKAIFTLIRYRFTC